MARVITPSYILTLRLKTNNSDVSILNKRMEIGRYLYNSVVGITMKRVRTMFQSKEYTNLRKELKELNKEYRNAKDRKNKKSLDKLRKAKYKELEKIYKSYNLDEYSLINSMTPLYKSFNKNIDNKTAQAIGSRAWKSFDKLLNGNGEKVYFKKRGEFHSLEGKWNKSGMRYLEDKGVISWNKLKIPVIVKHNDLYAQKALQDRVKYCRILRKEIKGKIVFYVQLILEGIPPIKVNKETGEVKSLGIGNVGIDIGTRTIAVSSKQDVKLMELAPSIEVSDKKIKFIQRKMDRSRRINNPNKYNENGTIKKGNRDKWIYSNRYLKLKALRKELFRKQTILRKQDHEIMSNYILSLGDRFLVEEMNFKGLQARAKKTTVNEKTGKINKKKRFGKSLSNKAPSMLLSIINRKLAYEKLNLIEINTKKVKASQFNHFTGEYHKKELKDRWNENIQIQRDMYSAFLIMNVTNDLETIDRDLCFKTYDNFKQLHDKEIKRLTKLKDRGCKMLSSMGI